MKRLIACMLSAAVVCTSAVAFGGCGQVVEDVDVNKTQLYVANYNGGVGEKWLDNAAERFENLHAETSFEEGRKGVQIIISHNKSYDGLSLRNSIATDSTYEIYFTGGAVYQDFTGIDALYDMTSLVNKVSAYDNTKLIDKMDEQIIKGLTVNDKIYGIPHYTLFDGPSYDYGLFEEKDLFFHKDIDSSDTEYPGTRRFVRNELEHGQKSCGPDGEYNTYDDGLPSTVQEFYKLMDKMVKSGIKPFVWPGGHTHYTNQVLRTLYSNLGGRALTNATLYMDSFGETVDIVTGFNDDKTPIIEKKVITQDNAYLVRQSAALYYVLEFAQNLRSNDNNYERDCISSTVSHISAMEMFINSGLNGEDYIAMIIDGNWWWNEANDDDQFVRLMEDYPDTYTTKDFKVMPLPVKYAGTVEEGEGHAPVMTFGGGNFCFVNKKISPSHVKAMEEFISFVYSNDELVEFTKVTNGCIKAVNYDYSTIVGELNSFAQSCLEMIDAAKEDESYICAMSDNKIHLNNAIFKIGNNMWLDATGHSFPIAQFTTDTTIDYVINCFNKMKITPEVWETINIYD